MGLLTNILLAPFLGPVWGTRWTLEKVDRVVREELTDDTPIKEDLMALQLQLDGPTGHQERDHHHQAVAREIEVAEDVERLADGRAAALATPSGIEEQDVVTRVVEESRPGQHLLARRLESVHEDDRRRAAYRADGPTRELDPRLHQLASGSRSEPNVFDHKVNRGDRIARSSRDELIGAGDRSDQPRDEEQKRQSGRDTLHRRFDAHSTASPARRSMIPR